ncbi:MAG: transposase [Spirochaetota bacterium]
MVEQQAIGKARVHDPVAFGLLYTIPDIGKILALVMIYEIDDINRFPRIGNFISSCRLVKPEDSSTIQLPDRSFFFRAIDCSFRGPNRTTPLDNGGPYMGYGVMSIVSRLGNR